MSITAPVPGAGIYCGAMMPPTRVRRGSMTPRWSYSRSSRKALETGAAGRCCCFLGRTAPHFGQMPAAGFVIRFIFTGYTGTMQLCPRMLVCDLDGTLLNGNSLMMDAAVAALSQAEAAGVEVVFATGRRHSFALDVLGRVDLAPETVLISSNGAVTRTMAGDPIRRVSMPVATALLLCRRLTDFRSSLVFTFERNGPGALVVEALDTLHLSMARWVETNAHEIQCVSPIERVLDRGEEPIQAMVCGTLARMADAIAVLEEISPEAELLRDGLSIHRTEYAARDLCLVDLLPLGSSKGKAVAELAAQRGIDATEIAAIGDNMNDADMLAFAGQAIVMRNAAPELLAMARDNGWFVTAGNEEDGAAQAILRMLQENLEIPSGAAAMLA